MSEIYEIFGDDPEEYKTLMDPDGDGIDGIALKRLKWTRRIPQSLRKVPRPEHEAELVKQITGFGVWYLTHYGAHLIGLICGPCATLFSTVIRLRTGIKQKKIPFLDKLTEGI